MTTLLAQNPNIPGYTTDVFEKGRVPSTMFSKFASLFSPNIPGSSLALVISRLIMFAIIVAGLIFFVQIISAGFSFLTSAGDTAKIQSATKSILTAAVGLLVVISAFFLAQIIQFIFGITII